MPKVVATRAIAASPQAVWEVVGDPHHLPRWWPRVTRVEGVRDGEFTEVLIGRKGKVVRADFDVLELVPERRVVWSQQVEGTPFEAVMRSAVTEIELTPVAASAGAETDVRIELRQDLSGPFGGGVRSGGRYRGEARGRGRGRGRGSSSGDGGDDRDGGDRGVGGGGGGGVGGGGRGVGGGMFASRVFGIARFGSPLVKRAAASTVEQALEGLARALGDER